MAKHDNQTRPQHIDTVLNATQAFIIEHVACNSNDEEISESFIKDDFGWYARVGTTKDNRKGMLILGQFCASFGGLVAGHAQRNYPGVLIAAFIYICSRITRLLGVRLVPGSKTCIALLQSRDCVPRRHELGSRGGS